MKEQIKVRRFWGELNPATRIRQNKKAYNRKKDKRILSKLLDKYK